MKKNKQTNKIIHLDIRELESKSKIIKLNQVRIYAVQKCMEHTLIDTVLPTTRFIFSICTL